MIEDAARQAEEAGLDSSYLAAKAHEMRAALPDPNDFDFSVRKVGVSPAAKPEPEKSEHGK